MSATSHPLTHLSPAAAGLGFAAARPRAVAVVSIITMTVLGWLWLGLAAGQQDAWALLCRPQSGVVADAGDVAVLMLLWCAMVLAMMVPSAAPMILTYAEIADTAAREKQAVVSPFILVAGYVAVWFGFAVAVTAVQIALSDAAWLRVPAMAGSGISGAVFIGAGLYQFSTIKQACLRLCRHPFQFFFTNWATTPRGVFRLGLRQGAYCLGCCGAMMLLMLTIGAVNVLWMAVLGVIMTIEKFSGMERFSRMLGLALVAIGGGFMLSALWSA